MIVILYFEHNLIGPLILATTVWQNYHSLWRQWLSTYKLFQSVGWLAILSFSFTLVYIILSLILDFFIFPFLLPSKLILLTTYFLLNVVLFARSPDTFCTWDIEGTQECFQTPADLIWVTRSLLWIPSTIPDPR